MKKIYIGIVVLFVLLFSVQQGCKSKSDKKETNATAEFTFKEKLSDYGFFTGALKDLQTAEGITHYDIVTPLFSDYTLKDRFIVLPKGKAIKYVASGALGFPDSTIIIKNFAYKNTTGQKIMIETRLLVKDPFDGQWKVMDYLWNKEQTDAIKHIVGAEVPITLVTENGDEISTNYKVPNVNDCKRCHNQNNVFLPIGPNARNLNFTLKGQTKNQLLQWASKGILTGLPDSSSFPKIADWKDAKNFTLNDRARAYLDVNCAHCHRPNGDASNTGLFLEYEQQDPFHIGVMKEPVSAGGGAGGLNYDIVPGDPDHSILYYRMNHAEANIAMPELARSVIHKEGVVLIKEWIKGLKK